MNADTSSGYTFFAPIQSKTSYLVDNFGRLINSWTSSAATPATTFLLPDGSILRCESLQNMSFNSGGSAGRLKRISWDGETTWTYDYSSSSYCQHHGFRYLPDGNVLVIAWELKSQTEASAAGRSTSAGGGFGGISGSSVWPCHIIEVKPSGSTGGTIVWEWHVWDHLIQDVDQSKDNYGVVEDHPELVDVNYTGAGTGSGDWMHTNNVDYNEDFDQILLSVRYFSEVWIIDHSTTKEEAASHSGGNYGKGGDLLYRFGNPEAYNSGSSSDRLLYTQHDAHWIPDGRQGAGNVIVFNNGSSSRSYSTVDEFSLPVDSSGNYEMNKAPENVWSYRLSGIMASTMSSAQRMVNGNTFICHGPNGKFFEVDSNQNTVWEYVSPVTSSGITQQYASSGGGFGMSPNQCFRATRYAPDYAAFDNKDMTPDAAPLEGGELITVDAGSTPVLSHSDVHVPEKFSLSNYTNPLNSTATAAINITIPQNTNVTVKIYNADGREIATLVNQYLSAGNYSYKWSTNRFTSGIYFVKLVAKNFATVTNSIVLLQ